MIAVDIALLPPKEVVQEIIKATSKLNHDTYPMQGADSYIPHITLRQGYMREEDIESTLLELQSLELDALDLVGSKIYSVLAPGTETEIACLEIDKTPGLMKLHEAVMELSSITQQGEGGFFDVGEPNMDPYIKTFAKEGAYEKFRPHITLGEGKSADLKLPMKFRASRVAICHLGKWWTCARILREYELQ